MPPLTPTAGPLPPVSPVAPTEGIWSSILKSVASPKSVLSKTVLVVGPPNSGKSAVINSIRQVPTNAADSLGGNDPNDYEIGLSYSWADVKDDDNEETVARLGLYHLSTEPAEGKLLEHAITEQAFDDTVLVIALDWSKPWDFVKVLEDWFTVLDNIVNQLGEVGENAKRNLETYLKTYTDPSSDVMEVEGDSATSVNASTSVRDHAIDLPLPDGCLIKNLGLPIVVVACKASLLLADLTSELERQRDYKEEKFDYIQQVLRTICLKYGAALFYTSSRYPKTLTDLRAYILHRLHPQSFSFTQRPEVVERDTVLVPSGWDSWGKIGILREGFDCNAYVGEGAHERYLNGIGWVGDETLPDQETVMAEPEQSFLQRLLDNLNSTVATPKAYPDNTRSSSTASAHPVLNIPSPGLNTETEDVTARLAKLAAMKEIHTPPTARANAADLSRISSDSISRAASIINTTSTTSTLGATHASGAPPTNQNEVLASFFQSLLAKKTTVSTGTRTGSSSVTPTGSLGRSSGASTAKNRSAEGQK
ncbi:dynein light intermediate chain-domain-containing protein [Gaertneriomyces semiglobifer]|nr:dynein light intermediate chain-domain-containing protein [Gaertneriomyces semiglobifer]